MLSRSHRLLLEDYRRTYRLKYEAVSTYLRMGVARDLNQDVLIYNIEVRRWRVRRKTKYEGVNQEKTNYI